MGDFSVLSAVFPRKASLPKLFIEPCRSGFLITGKKGIYLKDIWWVRKSPGVLESPAWGIVRNTGQPGNWNQSLNPPKTQCGQDAAALNSGCSACTITSAGSSGVCCPCCACCPRKLGVAATAANRRDSPPPPYLYITTPDSEAWVGASHWLSLSYVIIL